MKKIAMFLTLTATAILLGGCYFPPPPYQPGVMQPGPGPAVVRPIRPYHHPVVVPAPRVVVPLPPPVYYYR